MSHLSQPSRITGGFEAFCSEGSLRASLPSTCVGVFKRDEKFSDLAFLGRTEEIGTGLFFFHRRSSMLGQVHFVGVCVYVYIM